MACDRMVKPAALCRDQSISPACVEKASDGRKYLMVTKL